MPAKKNIPTGPDDPMLYPVRSVAVQVQGFLYVAGMIKSKGVTWLWLTADQQGYILRCLGRDQHWRFDDRHLSEIPAEYPRFFLGYVVGGDRAGRPPRGLTSGEDKLVDAAAMLRAVENTPGVKWVMGAEGVFALARAALGLALKPVAT